MLYAYLPTSSTFVLTYCYSTTTSVVLDLYLSLLSLIEKHQQQSYLHQIIIISFYNPLPEEEEEYSERERADSNPALLSTDIVSNSSR